MAVFNTKVAREKQREHRRSLQCEMDRKCVQESNSEARCDHAELEKKVLEYASRRRERIEAFVQHVRNKHELYLKQACPY